MKGFITLGNLLLVGAVITIIMFARWYHGSMTPLSAQEQEYFLQKLNQQTGLVAGFLNPEEARQFMASDDGRGFYVLNAFKFNKQAQYGEANSSELTGEEAFGRFTGALAPIWLAAGAHPVFSSSLDRKGYSDWDFVSLVRYRSRRDFFTVQTSEAFIAALPDRLAAAEENFRVKISGNQMPLPIVFLLVIIVLLVSLVAAVVGLLGQRRRSMRIPVFV